MSTRTQKIKKINLIKDASLFKYISKKQGSNPGGIFKSSSNAKYIVKIMDDEHIFNELLTSKLYKLLNVPVPELYVGTNLLFEDKTYEHVLLGKWIDGLRKVDFNIPYNDKAGYIYGVGADMWLANRDVIGPGLDNLLRAPNGRLIRVDVGGSMFMRAQAARGKKNFNNSNVPEIISFRNPEIAKVISSAILPYSEERLHNSLSRVAKLKDKEIKSTVMSVWNSVKDVLDIPKSLVEKYIDVLIKRKNVIALKLSSMNDGKIANKNMHITE